MGFDIAFGVLVLLAGLRGYRKGFASQMALLVGLALGIMFAEPVAKQLLPLVAPWIESYPQPIQWSIAYVGSVLAACAAVTLAGKLYLRLYRQHVFGKNVPSLQDRIVGTALGCAKGAVLFCLLLFLANNFASRVIAQPSIRQHYDDSRIVQLDNRLQPVDRVLEWPEVHRLRENVEQLVEYYRSREDSSGPPKVDTAVTAPAPGSPVPLAVPMR